MIDNTHKNVRLVNQINGKILRNGAIYQKIINPRDLCYQCSKDGPDFLFGKLIIRDSRYEPCFTAKNIIMVSNQNEYIV